jgi:hypothetical protein
MNGQRIFRLPVLFFLLSGCRMGRWQRIAIVQLSAGAVCLALRNAGRHTVAGSDPLVKREGETT